MSININTPEEIFQLVGKLTRFEMQYPQFARESAEQIAREEILAKIKERMAAKNYDKKIIDDVDLEFVTIDDQGFIDFNIVSDYLTPEGFDVAEMMEEGRREFFVKPVIKRALSWIIQAVRFFSKGHTIPERPGDKIVQSTIEEIEESAQDKLNLETDEFLDRSLS